MNNVLAICVIMSTALSVLDICN